MIPFTCDSSTRLIYFRMWFLHLIHLFARDSDTIHLISHVIFTRLFYFHVWFLLYLKFYVIYLFWHMIHLLSHVIPYSWLASLHTKTLHVSFFTECFSHTIHLLTCFCILHVIRMTYLPSHVQFQTFFSTYYSHNPIVNGSTIALKVGRVYIYRALPLHTNYVFQLWLWKG